MAYLILIHQLNQISIIKNSVHYQSIQSFAKYLFNDKIEI
ncbi:unnamed protein product (macronuclear) [Paramecium tetraurelia]|uniref:Uncharacterized protein n=1 Tax=Paramecium tetraurelia TaxID=5888 RepID=A0C2V3_PARTE|nr:uncharacterized protein GSPATT00034598001 [Paramecium tetraurelia]CAK65120.1 unnamed protein product [Paramecium tetraurelia]